MRRIISAVAVATVMGALMAVGVLPAFGAANEHASCQGAGHSNQTTPGAAGRWHSYLGPRRLNGDMARSFARLAPRGRYADTWGVVGPDFQGCGFPDPPPEPY